MRIAEDRLKKICARQGLTVGAMLRRAGVSRNAFYSLARKRNILPRSLTAIAAALDIAEADFLETDASPAAQAQRLRNDVTRVARAHRGADPENIRHTLQLLELKPIDRLRRALLRGQRFDFH